MKLLTCDTCGTSYRPDATPDGLCPTCLIARGSDEATRPPGTGPSDPRRAPPSLDELAPHFPQLELLEVLGRGGMGAVYKARQKELGRAVALKILPGDVGDDPDFAERFRREARALASLSHAGIVHVHDFGNSGGWWWFLMEYVDGATLRGLLADGPVEPSLALSIVRQVCDALAYAHGRGVVHRDIKPENILVDRDGRVKLVDFGLARLVGGDGRDLTLTYTGQRMGTPHYMAPEQWEDPGHVDHRADIYALGVVFYELLTSELPVGRFRPPSEAANVPADIDAIVHKALERDRERRYQHTSEMSTDCETSANRPAGTRAKRRKEEKAAASASRDAWLPEARGWGPWLAKTFWMLGSASVLAGVAALLAIASMLAGQQAVVSDWKGATGVSGAFGASIAAVLIGFAVAVFARMRAHTHDRRGAEGVEGVPRPWAARRWVVALAGVAAFGALSFAVEEPMWRVPLAGVFEFGVLLSAVAGVGVFSRLAWRMLPSHRLRRAVTVTVTVFTLLVVMGIFAERHEELRGAVAEQAVLYDAAGEPTWTAPTIDVEVFDALTDLDGQRLTTPAGAWFDARFVPRSIVARDEPGAVCWEVRVVEPPGVRRGTRITLLARMLDPSDRHILYDDDPGVAITSIELGGGAQVHRATVTVDLAGLARKHPDDVYATWEPSLDVLVSRPHGTVPLPAGEASWWRYVRRAGGAFWHYEAEPFTTPLFDRYPADHPRAVSDATVDLDVIGWRLLGRRTLHENLSDQGVDTQRTFDGMLRFGSVFDPPLPFAVEYDVFPVETWDGPVLDEPFGSGTVVMMPGEVVTFPEPDGSVPTPTDVGVSTELIPAWSERPWPITFTETGDDWRSRFADDVFNHRVDAVRLVLRPSRDAALAAPYDVTEYWAGDAIDVTVPLLR